MGFWKHSDVFPIAARIIRKLHRTHGGFIHHRAISAEMLQDPSASKLLRAVQKGQPERKPKWEAMAMVAAFSQDYPNSPYALEFQRERDRDGYAYQPRLAVKARERSRLIRKGRKSQSIDKQLDLAVEKIAPLSVQKAEEEIEKAAGFQPNSKIRKAIELHAMQRAETEFTKRGYNVTDESARQPFDLLCERISQTKYVEVKGAQGDGAAFVLTAGEANFIEQNAANCILCVVHGITVKGKRTPEASGGTMSVIEPFDLARGTLKPIAFTFRRGK